jgi:hypothetical protein
MPWTKFLLSHFLIAVLLGLFLDYLFLIETCSSLVNFLHILSILEIHKALGVLVLEVVVGGLLSDLIA